MKIAGYIALNDSNRPLVLQDSTLWMGNGATLFPTYEAARSAIRRTERFAIRRGYSWGRGSRIMRLVK